MVHLDYRDVRPIYTQIFENIRMQIRSGILQEGDRLPSVRELAAELAINPNTIQRAYRELEMKGWIATVPGKGCFVCGLLGENREQQPLWEALDVAAAALQDTGVSMKDILQHLQQGGDHHA